MRSQDLQELLERSNKCCTSISLSSPRLMIPSAVFGLKVLTHKFFTSDFFDFQVNIKLINLKKKEHKLLN